MTSKSNIYRLTKHSFDWEESKYFYSARSAKKEMLKQRYEAWEEIRETQLGGDYCWNSPDAIYTWIIKEIEINA